MRTNIAGSSPYEPLIGFSRAVRVGNLVYVSGTGPVGADDSTAEQQARHILRIIERTLQAAGADLQHVIRTRIYLTNKDDWAAVGCVHGEFFGAVRPAATMIVVAELLHPSWRVEIEADASLDSAENA